MNWPVGANCYLLRAVYTHGKDWDIVSDSLKALSQTFLKDENLQDLSRQSCSLQYNYIIASTRQRNPGDLTEDQLLSISLDHYTTLRREQLHAARLEILRAIKIEEEDAEKLQQARYSEIPLDRLEMYRKRCRALGIPDRIGQSLNLGPPSPTVEGSDETVKEFPVSPKRSGTELENEVVDKDGGIWFPVRTPYICDLFTEKPADAYHASVANFIRAQSVISQRLGLEGQNDEISSLDTTSSVQTHSEVASVHSEDAKAEESLEPSEQPSELDNSLSTTEIQTNPSKCLEIQAEPVTPSSLAIVTDSETLTSPHFTQSLNSSPALSNVEIHSPSSQNANRSRKRANAKRKAPSTAPTTPPSTTTVTAPVVNQSQESESTSALSPTLSTNPNNEEPVEVFQSSINIARGWRRSLLSVLSTVYSHRHAYVFMNPVTEDIAPGYGTVVHEPVDLTSLRRRMESSLSHLISSQQPSAVNPSVSSYQVIVEVATRFIRDLLLMFANARMYNSQNHEVHRMAGEMYRDVISEVRTSLLELSTNYLLIKHKTFWNTFLSTLSNHLQPPWSIMAEDIAGFPSLPSINSPPAQTARSSLQSSIVSKAPTGSPEHSGPSASKEDGPGVNKHSYSLNLRSNKRPPSEIASPNSPAPRKLRQSSGNDSIGGSSIATRSK